MTRQILEADVTDDQILAEMKADLDESCEWSAWVEQDEVKHHRSLGRRIGREQGWKISTHALPASNTRRVRVTVCVEEAPHREEVIQRGIMRIAKALDAMFSVEDSITQD